ncbi:hypothetical protein P3L10_019191 [Capsicum annuum]
MHSEVVELVFSEMVKRRGSSSVGRSNAPVGLGPGQDPTRGGGRVGSHPTMPQTRAQTNTQHGVWSGRHPQVAAPERVQDQVDHDTPAVAPVAVPTITLPADVVVRMLNILEALVSNQGRTPAPQVTLQTQAQVQLNVATSQAPLLIDHSIADIGQPKDLKNFMDLKPPEYVPSLVADQREKVNDL